MKGQEEEIKKTTQVLFQAITIYQSYTEKIGRDN